ncbi:MAG: CheR family methyltransferase [Candidatus Rifleibacteriota bacterium]
MMHTRFSPNELEEFCCYLKQEYGLSFSPEKYQQLENRIFPIMQEFSCRRLSDIIIQSKRDIRLRQDLVNSLTTNETWFFRHPAHFRILSRHILPQLEKRAAQTHDNRIKIWSAGCSIGAETFSILITLLENLKNPQDWNISLIGSDLASDAISRARAGIYNKSELKDIDKSIFDRYFASYGPDCYRIKDDLQKIVSFETLNLLDNWPPRKFDIIFCRNVMIYFSEEHKQKVTDKFLAALEDNGFYLTSANESIHWKTEAGLKKLFLENEYVYQKANVKESFRLYQFATPSDLLRALNILNQTGVTYGLEKINASHHLAPKRAIFISQRDSSRADELFLLSSIKVSSNHPYKKN